LDRALLDRLRAGADGADLVRSLVEEFLEEAESRVEALTRAAGGDAERVRREAHALRGSSATIGANRLADVCAQLERSAVTGAVGDEPGLAAQAREQLEAVRRELRDYASAAPRAR
jgi:two-component system sensor histidine kinase/response regulator